MAWWPPLYYYPPPYPPMIYPPYYPPAYPPLPSVYELQLLEAYKAQIEAAIRMLNEQLRLIEERINQLRSATQQQ